MVCGMQQVVQYEKEDAARLIMMPVDTYINARYPTGF